MLLVVVVVLQLVVPLLQGCLFLHFFWSASLLHKMVLF